MVGFALKHQNLPQEAVDFAAKLLKNCGYGEMYLENLSMLLLEKSCPHRTKDRVFKVS